jgi:error-prone DNA polymerase
VWDVYFIAQMGDGAEVTTAGMVIRRQRPHGKVVFITLEDEFGLIPLMVFPQVYERHAHQFKSPFLVVKGKLSRREGLILTTTRRGSIFNVDTLNGGLT